MRREPLQLVFWTPRQLHLMQPGCQERAEKVTAWALRRRSEAVPQKEPYWVEKAYKDFWNGKEWG